MLKAVAVGCVVGFGESCTLGVSVCLTDYAVFGRASGERLSCNSVVFVVIRREVVGLN